MKPIVLIHGYSAESRRSTDAAITSIYGTMPAALRERYGPDAVQEIDVSRYVTLEDGITVDDISRAFDRVLREIYPHLLEDGFHSIVHSTGALVIRNWIRTFSPKPSPLENLVYLAGANFGSGWAHIGKGQLSKWGKKVFQGGAERGLQVLDSLELGSSWTLDLHLHFLGPDNALASQFGVYEHVVIGTQTHQDWLPIPIRFVREDGADGVVRVAASNLNFNYLAFVPTEEALNLPWDEARKQYKKHLDRRGKRQPFYRVSQSSRPGEDGRPVIPFAIPFQCAHSGKSQGIVIGKGPRTQVLELIDSALNTTSENWSERATQYDNETANTYLRAPEELKPSFFKGLFFEPRAQYDKHAMVVFRLRDQDDRPIEHYDIYFDSIGKKKSKQTQIGSLIEHRHINSRSSNIIVFYLRTDNFEEGEGIWISRLENMVPFYLEITATEPETDEIIYLPMRFEFSQDEIRRWIRPHQTTVIDVQLLRLPSSKIFQIRRFTK